jgi:hypothetical protein
LIFCEGDGFHVSRIDAVPDTAEMVESYALGERFAVQLEEFEEHPVDATDLAVPARDRVASPIHRALPKPAVCELDPQK